MLRKRSIAQDVTRRGVVLLAAFALIGAGSCGGDDENTTERGADAIEEAAAAARSASGDFCAEYDGYIEYIDETGPVTAEENLEWYRRFDTPDELTGDVLAIIQSFEMLASHAASNGDTSHSPDELVEMREASQRISSYVESNC